jgi:hypothetical protein
MGPDDDDAADDAGGWSDVLAGGLATTTHSNELQSSWANARSVVLKPAPSCQMLPIFLCKQQTALASSGAARVSRISNQTSPMSTKPLGCTFGRPAPPAWPGGGRARPLDPSCTRAPRPQSAGRRQTAAVGPCLRASRRRRRPPAQAPTRRPQLSPLTSMSSI